MSYSLVMEYFNAMEIIEANNQLSSIQASAFADYNKKDQTRIIKNLNKTIKEGLVTSGGKVVSTDDLANILARGMNG